MDYKKLNLKVLDKMNKVYYQLKDKKVYDNIELFSYYNKLCLLEHKIYKRYIKLKLNVNI